MKKSILIVYEKIGMGHLRMAKIIKDMIQSDDLEVIVEAGSNLMNTSDIETIGKIWNFLIRKKHFRTADILINFLLRFFALPFLEIDVKVVDNFFKRLDSIKPDMIISTADGFNKVIGSYCCNRKIPFSIVITEISIFFDLVNSNASHICYFDETINAIHSFDLKKVYYSFDLDNETSLKKRLTYVYKAYLTYIRFSGSKIFRNVGYEKSHKEQNDLPCLSLGPIVEFCHFKYLKKNIEIYSDLKEKYNILPNSKTIMLASGSLGGAFLTDCISIIIEKYKGPITLFVLCGNDNKIHKKIKTLSSSTPVNIKIIPFKYVDYINDLMTISDCLVARPSAGIFMESLVNRCPMIIYGKMTSNDKGTVGIIKKYNTGKVCDKKGDLIKSLIEILENKDRYQKNIDLLLSKYPSTYEAKAIVIRDHIRSRVFKSTSNFTMFFNSNQINKDRLSELDNK